jgi:glycosyltransferase involved in cell wall biosynthesis
MVAFIVSIVTLLLLVGFAQEWNRLRTMPRLALAGTGTAESIPGTVGSDLPLISVLIPARNEEQTIGRCLDGVLAQTCPPYEIIVVNDASTDETAAILAHYAQQHAHLHVIQSAPLPPEWTGKAYACQQAATVARGEWLLFLDADTTPQPDLIAALVTHAQRQQLDLLTIFPFLELRTFWERVILPPFLAIIHATFPFERLNAPDVRSDEVIANGQCILVTQHAYQTVGGHGSICGAVLEDVQLARQIRAAGFRTGAAEGIDYLRVRMYTSGRQVFEGLTKNAIAGYLSGGEQSLWSSIRQFLLILAPLWLNIGALGLMFSYGDIQARVVCLAGVFVALVALGFWGMLLWKLYKLPWYYAPLWPFGMICYGCITLYGLWRIRMGHGVIWKGRTYVGT